MVTLGRAELPAGVSLMLRRMAVEPTGGAGDLLMAEQAEGLGEPVTHVDNATSGAVAVTLPAGRWILVPFSVLGGRAVRGTSVNVEIVPPVNHPEAVRNGADVLVSWSWPEGLRLARVAWRGDGDPLDREVALNEFRRLGGVLFRRSDAAKIRISGVVRSGEDMLTSVPITIDVAAQQPTLTYKVLRVSRFLGLLPPWSARRRVLLTTDLPCAGVRVEIYMHTPQASQNSDLAVSTEDDLELAPGCWREVRVVLPKLGEMKRPSYVSCRARTASGEIRVDNLASSGREVR
jgi:hypothetical protein